MVFITPRLFEVRFRKSTAGTRFYGSRQVSQECQSKTEAIDFRWVRSNRVLVFALFIEGWFVLWH